MQYNQRRLLGSYLSACTIISNTGTPVSVSNTVIFVPSYIVLIYRNSNNWNVNDRTQMTDEKNTAYEDGYYISWQHQKIHN